MSRVFIIAGEPSGDILGARVMASLKTRSSTPIEFLGVGGSSMTEQGMVSLFPMSDLSVMGLAEIIPKLPQLLQRIKMTAAAIINAQPDVIITIDAPDFCFRVAKRAKTTNPQLRIVHLVAPTVWAWRPGRAKRVAGFLDHMLCLLPFEPPYFVSEGLEATFIGHPVIESGADQGEGALFRKTHGIADDAPLLAVLPGSRTGEVTRHLPIFRETALQLAKIHPGLICVFATVPHVADRVKQITRDWPTPVITVDGTEENGAKKYAGFAAANVALAASGTVSVELALAGCPSVIAYRVNAFTAAMAKRLIRVKFASIINLIANQGIIPEFIQEHCQPANLCTAVSTLLSDEKVRDTQKTAFTQAIASLGKGGPPPSDRAADTILPYLDNDC